MVSIYVVSMFTGVPTDETLTVVRNKLTADPSLKEHTCIPIDNLMEMLTLCMETTYFGRGSDIYWQEELDMGSPWSIVLANIYIKYLEEMALRSASLKPSLWFWYVDDTFIRWLHQEDVQTLQDHVNPIWSTQFTIVKEEDNILSFLDVLITRTEKGFRSSGYRNPTFTGPYLNFNSHHPYNVKKGIIRCLQLWAKGISSDSDEYQEGMKSFRDILHRNNYSDSIRNLDRTTKKNIRKYTTVCLPYIKGLAKKDSKDM